MKPEDITKAIIMAFPKLVNSVVSKDKRKLKKFLWFLKWILLYVAIFILAVTCIPPIINGMLKYNYEKPHTQTYIEKTSTESAR
jgi:hypothetical protein